MCLSQTLPRPVKSVLTDATVHFALNYSDNGLTNEDPAAERSSSSLDSFHCVGLFAFCGWQSMG